MRFSNIVAASLVAPLVAAHGGMEGAPKMFGLPKQLRARNPFAAHQAPRDARPYAGLHARQSTDGRCGPQGSNQVCASNECCSAEGYCGTTVDHCEAPDCLIDFGPACDANKTPNGATTRNDARPQLGSISYGGAGIYSCNKPGTVALTFDDGPYIYTADVLDLFKAKGAKATFFITGNNNGKGAIDENWSAVINRMEAEGHQIASHTWSHQDLSKITEAQVYDQMVKNEMAIRNILGKYPTYMRPPYSSCEATCQNVMAQLGYVVTYFDLDTDDYNQLTTEKIQVAKDNFKNGIDNRNVAPADGDKLSIAHDIHELTAHNLTAYMLDYVYSNGLTAVTVGECLNDPKANWYRSSTPAPASSSTRSSSAPASTPTGPTSTDATCGGTKGQSCVGFVMNNGLLGECCSSAGYCGSSSDYCGTGCQSSYGKCGAQPSASPSATSTGPVPTATGKSSDGSCGSTKGLTCAGFIMNDGALGECCSAYGYCGATSDYCGTGCQAGFGKCGTSSSSSSSVVSSSARSSSASSSAAASSSVASTSVTSRSASVSSSTRSASVTARSSSVSSSARSASATTSSYSASSASVRGSSSASSASVRASSSATSSYPASSASVRGSSSASSSHPASSASVRGSSTVASSYPASSASVRGSSSAASSYPASSARASSSVVYSATSGGYPASTPLSITKDSYPSGSKTNSAVYPASSSNGGYPASSKANSAVYPASSSQGGYPASSFSTIVKPSTSCSTTAKSTPTPTPVVSKDGKCGSKNGGQTCAGYKNSWGLQIECCCKESGKCSVDPWACGVGCDKGYGKCWF